MKPPAVKIITISTSYEPARQATIVYGAGDDNVVYVWHSDESAWYQY